MNISQKKIYSYFERDPQLRVLFLFNMPFVKEELSELEWADGYRYIVFKGDWFTVKYRLENEWANDKVVLYFDQPSPTLSKADMAAFPLMDVLSANMEYHSQDHTSFMQQYGLPESMAVFVERNIMQLQTEKMLHLLQPYFSDKSINNDIGVRAFLSSYLGLKYVLEWDDLIIQMIILGRSVEEKKRLDFYSKLSKALYIKQFLDQKLTGIFGISYDVNSPNKVEKIVQIIKYNAIIQNLAPVELDDYKASRITDSVSLQHINRILERALSSKKTAVQFKEALDELGAGIRDENIISWYGVDVNYYYVPDGLCIPIIKRLIQSDVTDNPDKVISRLNELMLKHNENPELMDIMEYLLVVARFYERNIALGSLTLNSPSDYVSMYQTDFFLLDKLYRQATENYYKISPNSSLFDTIQNVKRNLDVDYAKLSNRLNLEWINCVKDAGGFGSVDMLRLQDFYNTLIKPVQKKVAVIVCDALRYELADCLVSEISKSRHIARLDCALAMLPTETKYCKPALLPHKSLMLYGANDEQNMSVDNKILDSTSKRSEHLASYKTDAICVTFDEIAQYNRDKNREIFKHPLVYIFHDNIDSIGHDGSAKNIVNGCTQAIVDIATMIKKIHSTYNVTEVYVTADHGFLFNDMEFAEKDKLKVTDNALERKSRYYLTDDATLCADITKFKLSDVSRMDAENIYVGVPTGTNRLAAPSGGYMFAHGGASLQEMIIPVIISRQERTDSKEPVGIMLLDKKLTVAASRLRFSLLQTDPVSEDMKERVITVALYRNDEAVTPIKQIVLDKSDSLLDARKYIVDLTLNKNVGTNVLQLKIYDIEDNMNPLIKENVTNSTLIQNDFFDF